MRPECTGAIWQTVRPHRRGRRAWGLPRGSSARCSLRLVQVDRTSASRWFEWTGRRRLALTCGCSSSRGERPKPEGLSRRADGTPTAPPKKVKEHTTVTVTATRTVWRRRGRRSAAQIVPRSPHCAAGRGRGPSEGTNPRGGAGLMRGEGDRARTARQPGRRRRAGLARWRWRWRVADY